MTSGVTRDEDALLIPPFIVLDTGPLSNCVMSLAKPNETPTLSQQCRQWLND